MPGFSTILIANRGEIACRIIRSAHALGYRTVAVYSEAEADALHVRLADRAICIGPPPVRDSYLAIDRILAAARRSGADAVHPGYGFLSENEDFAAACAGAGLTFIGPPPAAIRLMGNKAQAKVRMIAAGVPCVPGYSGDGTPEGQGDARLLREAAAIGFPLLIKAAAGGGGRGMRLVKEPGELEAALTSARSEATSAFGSGEVILERALVDARHVEIQVFADALGKVVHLGERDCSIQRRHQKIVEEAPSPVVSRDLRERMGAAAVQAARAIGYVGAGTVEFLLDAEGHFYFLEMNTRLQVEHPVTELCTGLDLVELQLRVAAGEALGFGQEDVELRGHAIEVRLYAEDPYNNFLPCAGPVLAWSPAAGEGVRVDHGLAAGQAITPYYDPMVAKVIAHGPTRSDARRRLARALRESVLLGPEHNKRFLLDVLRNPVFAAGDATTRFIERDLGDDARRRPSASPGTWALAALLWSYEGREPEAHDDPWQSSGAGHFPLILRCGDDEAVLEVRLEGARAAVVRGCPGAEGPLRVALLGDEGPRRQVEIDGLRARVHALVADGALHLEDEEGALLRFSEVVPRGAEPESQTRAGDGKVRAPTSGRVVRLPHAVGAAVAADTVVAIVESMKIETSLAAGIAGTIRALAVEAGALVKPGALLVEIEPEGDGSPVA
ncbi:MAG: acetyl-CoA carboxylase biotin carboxylase subunit [Myxococcales bacterium]|nr:acetyl-CoA carboxylase biotin carboxylase subunit [Myxococcales bacterium]